MRWLIALLVAASATGYVTTARAAAERPVVTLTPGQEKSMREEIFNCDHEGELGCLQIACRPARLTKQGMIDVQYLYRDVAKDFPELITPKLRACFKRAGGRFR